MRRGAGEGGENLGEARRPRRSAAVSEKLAWLFRKEKQEKKKEMSGFGASEKRGGERRENRERGGRKKGRLYSRVTIDHVVFFYFYFILYFFSFSLALPGLSSFSRANDMRNKSTWLYVHSAQVQAGPDQTRPEGGETGPHDRNSSTWNLPELTLTGMLSHASFCLSFRPVRYSANRRNLVRGRK